MGGRDHAELCTGEQRTRAWIQSAGGQIGRYRRNEEVSEPAEVAAQDDHTGIEHVDDHAEALGQAGSQVIEGIEDLLVPTGCTILNLGE